MHSPTTIGIQEERILMLLANHGGSLYGVQIGEALEQATGRDVSIGAIYTTLERLEEKKLVESTMGAPTAERGGRAKRFYAITSGGREVLKFNEEVRALISRSRFGEAL